MTRIFDRNMLIMLVSIMIGAIIITYFVADLQRKSQVEGLQSTIDLKDVEIETIESMSVNFTNSFLKSSVLLDMAREDRASGNLPFDLAVVKYSSALITINSSVLEEYKSQIFIHCDEALVNYTNSHLNFLAAGDKFQETIEFTSYQNYIVLLESYTKLCKAGAELTHLRQNASIYLKQIAENMSVVDGAIAYDTNITDLLDNYNMTMSMYGAAAAAYEEIYEEEIAEYDIVGFDPINR